MRWLYLHGFASGPSSTKGVWLERAFAARGVPLERLDLRLPSFAHLRLSAMIDDVRARVVPGTVVFGSSLGGLVAARVAEAEPGVVAAVLLAPAFRMAERWAAREPEAVAAWEREGWREVDDHTTGGKARIDWGFFADARATDRGWPEVGVPTLLVHGVRDDVVDIGHSRAWAASRPHVRMVEVDDGHELVASLPRIDAEAAAFLAPWLPR